MLDGWSEVLYWVVCCVVVTYLVITSVFDDRARKREESKNFQKMFMDAVNERKQVRTHTPQDVKKITSQWEKK